MFCTLPRTCPCSRVCACCSSLSLYVPPKKVLVCGLHQLRSLKWTIYCFPTGSQHTASKWHTEGVFSYINPCKKYVRGWRFSDVSYMHDCACSRIQTNLCMCRCFNLFWRCSFTYIKVWEWVLFFRCVCRHTYCAWILACSSCVQTGFLKMSLCGSHWNMLDLEW